MGFKIGDRVKTCEGLGTIIYIRDSDCLAPILVEHDVWDKGHNGKSVMENLTGNHCWWYRESFVFKISESIVTGYTGDYNIHLTYDEEQLYQNIVKEMKEKGENNMKNEVLKLYYDRKHDEIIKKYEKKEQEYINNIEVVNKYNELIENFKEDMETLYTSVDNFNNDYLTQNCDEYMLKYKVNTNKISNDFKEKYITKRQKELDKLNDLRDEVEAQLSLSNDLEYQMEVLTRYGILDKKTKKIVD